MVRGSELTVNSLFYDALSGEFLPFGSETKHTLGRLAVATFQRGEETLDDPINELRSLYEATYTPSWAPGVKTIVSCIKDSDQALLRELRLVAGTQRLNVSHLPEPNFRDGLWLTHKHLDRPQPHFDGLLKLELGPELGVTQAIVASQAGAFFATRRQE